MKALHCKRGQGNPKAGTKESVRLLAIPVNRGCDPPLHFLPGNGFGPAGIKVRYAPWNLFFPRAIHAEIGRFFQIFQPFDHDTDKFESFRFPEGERFFDRLPALLGDGNVMYGPSVAG